MYAYSIMDSIVAKHATPVKKKARGKKAKIPTSARNKRPKGLKGVTLRPTRKIQHENVTETRLKAEKEKAEKEKAEKEKAEKEKVEKEKAEANEFTEPLVPKRTQMSVSRPIPPPINIPVRRASTIAGIEPTGAQKLFEILHNRTPTHSEDSASTESSRVE
jgi:hypothetical protein